MLHVNWYCTNFGWLFFNILFIVQPPPTPTPYCVHISHRNRTRLYVHYTLNSSLKCHWNSGKKQTIIVIKTLTIHTYCFELIQLSNVCENGNTLLKTSNNKRYLYRHIYRGLQVRATPGQRQWSFANWLIATLSLIAASLNSSKHYHSPSKFDTWHSNSLYSNASSRLNDSHCVFVSHGICYNEAEVDLCFCWGVELFGGCIRVFFVFGCQAWEDMRSDCWYFRQGNKGTVFMQEESDWYIYI